MQLICREVGEIRRSQDKCAARFVLCGREGGQARSDVARGQDYLHQITYNRATRDPKPVVL